MCHGNRAPQAIRYLNQQLFSHWDNAKRCVETHACTSKPLSATVEYGMCLREYFHGFPSNKRHASKEDHAFYAKFGAPELRFICNHDAVLIFTIEEGHFNLNPNRPDPYVPNF
jgi:hypothetical protein